MATVIRVRSHPLRPILIGGAGAAVLLLSVGAAFLSKENGWAGSGQVAGLLLGAGLLEISAGTLRTHNRLLAVLSGGATSMAGLLLLAAPVEQFVPTIYVLIGWLVTRGVLLTIAGLAARGTLRIWTFVSAAMDSALGGILLASLSAMTFPIWLFGPTPEMTMSFCAVLALSFVVSGAYLIEVATTEQCQD